MLRRLQLENFQIHESLDLVFTEGLNVIRGENEAGKSTIFRAISFALFGSRSLPHSIEDLVTWGTDVKKLKVTLSFVVGGIEYTITRAKSGASMSGSDGSLSSGQAEVTAAVERLLGASAAVVRATALSHQASLQDGLGSSSVELIEKLADMQVIDNLIGHIDKVHPTGNTRFLEAEIKRLAEVTVPEKPPATLADAVSICRQELEDVEKKQATFATAYHTGLAAKQRVEAANAQEAAHTAELNRLIAASEAAQERFSSADSVLKGLVKPLDSELEEIYNLKQIYEGYLQVWEDYTNFTNFVRLSSEELDKLDRSGLLFTKSSAELENEVATIKGELNSLSTQIAVKRSQLITESFCGLCGKDLANVPEVVEKNAEIERILASLTDKEAELQATLVIVQSDLRHTRKFEALVQSAKNTELQYKGRVCRDGLKLNWTYPLPEVSMEEIRAANFSAKLQAFKDRKAAYERAKSTQTAAFELLESTKTQLAAYRAKTAEGVSESDKEIFRQFPAVEKEYQSLTRAVKDAQAHLDAAVLAKTQAETRYSSELSAFAEVQKQLADRSVELKQCQFYNGIIEKLKTARPKVAKKLWTLLLTSVSHYFSQMRGTQSTVDKTDSGFLIDSKSSALFSGSTKDCLGLAIRITLQKTFLPSVGFLMVDEPAAALSETRESQMLGTLSSLGFDQILLVTHSDLADTYATNFVSI